MKLNERVVILENVCVPLYWLMLTASLTVLLRGHNEPGGGFIAGLLAASASVLWAVARGTAPAGRRLPFGSPLRLAASGVLVGAASGMPALLQGQPFLHHLWWDIPLGFATLPVSTVLMFDLGVYLCVWGGVAGYSLELLGQDEHAHDVRREGRA
ncbi:MAG: MnhB domain-containing protein [Pseudomonadota bacterium]|nr:MnhB domain-containing protein [Pseudomonadota bacterium]